MCGCNGGRKQRAHLDNRQPSAGCANLCQASLAACFARQLADAHDGAAVVHFGGELINGLMENGMLPIRGDLLQRRQYEPALMQPRVRNRERRGLDHFVSTQKNIDVQRPCTQVFVTNAAMLRLDILCDSQDLLCIEACTNNEGNVQESGLITATPWLGLIKGGAQRFANPVVQGAQLIDRCAEDFLRGAKIGSERKRNAPYSPAWRNLVNHVSCSAILATAGRLR
jgi:hypothetical protein